MRLFSQWCKETGKELPDVPTSENTKRSGIRGAYPDGYVRSQYPSNYFTPIAADAPVQLKNAGKSN
jgi:hypothetical protein